MAQDRGYARPARPGWAPVLRPGTVSVTPEQLCRGLLEALDASEGRRRRRSRNTTADSIGLDIQRTLLEDAVREAPPAEHFERWLLERCVAQGESDGAHRAMALSIWHEWLIGVGAGRDERVADDGRALRRPGGAAGCDVAQSWR